MTERDKDDPFWKSEPWSWPRAVASVAFWTAMVAIVYIIARYA